MPNAERIFAKFLLAAILFCLSSILSRAQTGDSQPNPTAGPGTIFVHPKFGGQIFGFDIDQNGTEGVLSETLSLSNGKTLSAVETFSQTSGKILNVVDKIETPADDFVTIGIVGSSVGLLEHQHPRPPKPVIDTFDVINPLTTNQFTGLWKPPAVAKGFFIREVSRNQGEPTNAFLASSPSPNGEPVVFSSNVAANTFGPQIPLTNQNFTFGVLPALGYDSVTNQAVLAQSIGSRTSVPEIGLVDLAKGTTSTFTGTGLGFVNAIAVDSTDGIACTATEIDFSVEFYNLAGQTGFKVVLPGATDQQQSGVDVEFDRINKLFLVAQPVSSTSSGSSIQVYDPQGNLVESINGFNFSNDLIVPFYIALNPGTRTGFILPTATEFELQSFTY